MSKFKNMLTLSLILLFIHCDTSSEYPMISGKVTGLDGTIVLQNNGEDDLTIKKNGAFKFANVVLFTTPYKVTVKKQPSGQVCVVSHEEGVARQSVDNVKVTCADKPAPSNPDPGPVTLPTSISVSVTNLNLSVNDTTTNAALTGAPRIITVTNTGFEPTQAISVFVLTSFPSGTTISSNTCGVLLAPGSDCTITITPGSSPTAASGDMAPDPVPLAIEADNTNTLGVNVQVLTYGSYYQGGFIFAVDDTTPDTDGIRGKIASLVDQAPPDLGSGGQPTSIIWASNGNGNTASDTDYVAILGIDETSTALVPSPTSPAYPMGTPAYTACNGHTDGRCNTDNIVSYYNFNRTSGGAAPTPLTFYAAGLCKATINSYSDWYLPSICEMGEDSICPANEQTMAGSLSFLVGDLNLASPNTNCNPPMGTECMGGLYWSSTEYSFSADISGLVEQISTGFSGLNGAFAKEFTLGVRCARSITL